MEPFTHTMFTFWVKILPVIAEIVVFAAVVVGIIFGLGNFYLYCERKDREWIGVTLNVFMGVLAFTLMLAWLAALIDRADNPNKYKTPAEAAVGQR